MPRSLADLQLSEYAQNFATFVGTDRAAGQEILETIPAGQTWRIYAVRFNLQTSAVVANRRPNILLKDGSGNTFAKLSAGAAIPASQNTGFTYACGLGVTGQLSDILGPLPDPCYLPSGYTLGTTTDSFDAGDNYSSPIIFYELMG